MKTQLFSPTPLRTILIVPFVTLTVLVVGLVGYLSFRNGEQAINDVALQLRTEITTRIETYVGTFLDTPPRINQLNADALREGFPPANDSIALERHLREQIQNFETVSSIYFGNPAGGLVDAGREGAQGKLYVITTEGLSQGSLYKYATDQQGNRTELLVTVPSFDARTRPWYTSAIKHNGPTWSEVYVLSTGQDLAIASSRPIYDDQQQLLGVASVDIFLSHLSNFLKSLTIGKTGQSFIIERSGLLIASSVDEKPFTLSDDQKTPERLQASQSASPLIRAAAEALTQHNGTFTQIATKQQFEFEWSGQRYFINVAPVQTGDGIDWLIVVVIPESDFMAHINANNQTTAALSGLALLGAVVFGFAATHWITQPIAQLKGAAQALAKGEWRPVTSTGRIDEIGELTYAFNHMAEHLQQTLTSLTAEISARRAAETALQNQLEFVSTLLETIPTPVFYKDQTGRYTGCNQAFDQFLGYARSEIIGKTVYDLVPPDIAAKYRAMDEVLFTNPGDQTYEWHVLTSGGKNHSVIFNKATTKDAFGNITGLVGIITDITERKQAEIALRESQEQLDLVVKAAELGTWDWHIPSRNVVFNERWAEMLGYDLAEIEPHVGVWEKLIHPEDLTEVLKVLQAHLTGNTPLYQTEHRLRTKSGEWKWILDTGKVIVRDEEGQPIRAAGIHQDITERKLLEENLREARKMEAVGQLAAGMAHHYNSLLTAIIGFTSLSLQMLPPGDPIARNLNQVLNTAEQAATLVRQLLAFARKQLLQPKTVSLNELVLTLKDKLENSLTGAIELNLNLAPDLGWVKMDPSQFEHLLLSLTDNACDAMPEGGRLTVTTANITLTAPEADLYQVSAGEYVLLTVQDTGLGLTEAAKGHLFEPFFTTKEVGRGTGLGLAMSLGIAKQHGGHLLAESQSGQGAAFTVYLPRTTSPVPPLTSPVPISLLSGTETILLVEDEPIVREFVTQILSQQGYIVLSAAGGEAALQLLNDHAASAPQLLLTNLNMPGLSGDSLVKQLRSTHPDLKVLFFFEPAGEGSPEASLPGVAFLAKPFKPSVLTQRIRTILDNGSGPA